MSETERDLRERVHIFSWRPKVGNVTVLPTILSCQEPKANTELSNEKADSSQTLGLANHRSGCLFPVSLGRDSTILSSSCDAKIKQDILIFYVVEWFPTWLSPTASSDMRHFYRYSASFLGLFHRASISRDRKYTYLCMAFIYMMQTGLKFIDGRTSRPRVKQWVTPL